MYTIYILVIWCLYVGSCHLETESHDIEVAGLQLSMYSRLVSNSDPPSSASQELGLKACATRSHVDFLIHV